MDKLVNAITYGKGDIVIRKSKAVDLYGNAAKAKKVIDTKIIDGGSGNYQILYFEGESFPGVAWEYEPYDETQRKEYYDYINKIRNNKVNKSNNSTRKTDKKSKTSNINVEELAKRMFK